MGRDGLHARAGRGDPGDPAGPPARFGAKRVYLISLALFTAGSVLCGLASSTEELIVFRVLQGFGGGMILPIGQHGTAFWFAGGLTALAIVPCIILMRAERAARAAKGDEGTPPDVMAEAVAA